MSKKMKFGEKPPSQRERCLEVAARLRDKGAMVTPTDVTTACIKEGVFTAEQLVSFQFQRARQMVEQWLKTADAQGLPIWGQLPMTNPDGERFWQPRERMGLRGYAWNWLLRDDMVQENLAVRDRWKTEALERWTSEAFDATVGTLREEREQESDAA